MKLSLSGKIIALVMLTVLVVGGVTFWAAYYSFSKGFDDQAARGIDATAKAVQGSLDDMMDKLKKHSVSFSSRSDIMDAVAKKGHGGTAAARQGIAHE
jgi:hypothetical protein